MENERITFLLSENKKLANRNDDLEKKLLIKDEIIRKQMHDERKYPDRYPFRTGELCSSRHVAAGT